MVFCRSGCVRAAGRWLAAGTILSKSRGHVLVPAQAACAHHRVRRHATRFQRDQPEPAVVAAVGTERVRLSRRIDKAIEHVDRRGTGRELERFGRDPSGTVPDRFETHCLVHQPRWSIRLAISAGVCCPSGSLEDRPDASGLTSIRHQLLVDRIGVVAIQHRPGPVPGADQVPAGGASRRTHPHHRTVRRTDLELSLERRQAVARLHRLHV